MSAHVPQQPDLAAVRALRRAAASLGEPLGALSVTLAAAEQLPGVLSPAFDLVSFSPFGAIPDVGGVAGAAQPAAAAAARRQAPTPGSLLGQAGAAAGQAAGARAAAAPARQAPASATAPEGEGFFPTVVEAVTKAATTAAAVTAASVEAVAAPGPGAPAKPVPRRGAAPSTDPISGAIGLLGALVDQIGDTTVREVGNVVGSDAPRSRSIGGTVLDAVTSEVGKAIEATAGVAGPRGAAIGQTIAEGITTAADVVAPPQMTLYDLLSTSLLVVEEETMFARWAAAQQASAAGGQAAPAPGAAPAQPAAPKQSANGTVTQTVQAVQAAPPDPADLAWLVNEALIEQARRHGMDIS